MVLDILCFDKHMVPASRNVLFISQAGGNWIKNTYKACILAMLRLAQADRCSCRLYFLLVAERLLQVCQRCYVALPFMFKSQTHSTY